MKKNDPVIMKERSEAWVGDAVLALFAREWILAEYGKMDGERFVRFTSNDFLRRMGNPTSVEAEIGRVYKRNGLEAAFSHLEEHVLPLFIQLEKARVKQRK